MRRHHEQAGGAKLRAHVSAAVLALSLASPGLARAAPASEAAPACDPDSGDACEVAPEPGTAGEWYTRGIELASNADYAAAAAAFLRSYELRATPEALFNAAFAWEKAGATIAAISTYERFLAEPARTQEYVEPAQRAIEALTRTLGVLKGVRYDPERPPTQVLVQGEPVELDAFPILVTPGNIEIEVVDEQGRRAHEFYELSAGEALVVDLRALLPPLAEPTHEPPQPEIVGPSPTQLEHARRASSLRKLTWVGVGLTGATALAAGTLGVLALRERRLFGEQTCAQFEDMNCPPDWPIGDPQRHYDLYGSYALTGTVLASVSGALAIGSLVIGLVSVRHERASRLTRMHDGRARVQLIPQLGGLQLRF